MYGHTLHRMERRTFVSMMLALPVAGLATVGCGGGGDETGLRLVNPDEAADYLFEAPPADLVVLDVRTPDEYEGGRLPDAQLLDFYRADFADRLAELPKDVPYLLYCRSGNRSGQTRALMEQMGFTDVADVDGGIAAWLDAGHPYVVG